MRKLTFISAIGISLLTIVALYFQMIHPYQIQVRDHFVSSAHIPSAFNGARLIQISDLRIETNRDVRALERVVDQINDLSPDMVAFTGDLFGPAAVSSSVREETRRILSAIQADMGKIAVLGTLDLEREEEITEILTAADFHILRNEAREFFNMSEAGIVFLGMDPISHGNDPALILPRIQQPDMFQILLTHEGHLAAHIVNHPIGLQMSGYCLGRSRPPLQCSQFSRGAFRFADQLVNISSGVGTDNSIFGFLKRPSIDSFLLMRQ